MAWLVGVGGTYAAVGPTTLETPVGSLLERLGTLGLVVLVAWWMLGRADRREDRLSARLVEQLTDRAGDVAGLRAELQMARNHADGLVAELGAARRHAAEMSDRLMEALEKK
jgi:hypothetical protein